MSRMIEKLGDVARRITGARDALAEVHRAESELRAAHQAAVAERDRLLSAKPPRAEIAASISAAVDAIADEWRRTNGEHLLGATVVDARAGSASFNLNGLPNLYGPAGFALIAALAPGPVKAALASAIDATTYAPGPPLGERPRLIADLDARIERLEDEHSSLVDEARENGIMLDLLPAVAARRRTATR